MITLIMEGKTWADILQDMAIILDAGSVCTPLPGANPTAKLGLVLRRYSLGPEEIAEILEMMK
jgi:hypothetical protein